MKNKKETIYINFIVQILVIKIINGCNQWSLDLCRVITISSSLFEGIVAAIDARPSAHKIGTSEYQLIML